jgi:hypothetical protein
VIPALLLLGISRLIPESQETRNASARSKLERIISSAAISRESSFVKDLAADGIFGRSGPFYLVNDPKRLLGEPSRSDERQSPYASPWDSEIIWARKFSEEFPQVKSDCKEYRVNHFRDRLFIVLASRCPVPAGN